MRLSLGGMALEVVLVAACAGDKPTSPAGSATRFAEPLAGTLNRRFFYLNYVDELSGSGIHDYTCGLKTYDGHRGTDITLANFAVMDSGVAVRAAAAGTVIEAHDGEFDRQKAWINGAQPNYVVVRHPDGLTSSYLHLKKNSVAVSVGKHVQAGDLLGHVGSSGFSDIPHLHFEVHGPNGELIDPWLGACGSDQSRWQQQLPYQDAFQLYGAGLSGADLTLDLAKDPPVDDTLYTTADARVAMWVELINVPEGAAEEFRLYDPAGGLVFSYPFTMARFYGISWWWVWHAIPGYLTPGRWRMQFRHNGVMLSERAFTVLDAGAPAIPTIQGVPAGAGGGSAGKPY